MPAPPLAAVHAGQLLEVLWVSVAAGIAVTVIFSLVVSTSIRSGEARRAGRDGPATGFAVAAVVCFAAFAALVAFAVQTLLAKG
jgi:hypothetical protein